MKSAQEIFDAVWKVSFVPTAGFFGKCYISLRAISLLLEELQCDSGPKELSWMESSKFQSVVNSELCEAKFLNDVHSWKWYFACGRRFLIIGLGVRESCTVMVTNCE